MLRRPSTILSLFFLTSILLACLASLPYTLTRLGPDAGEAAGAPRYNAQDRLARNLPPSWIPLPDLSSAPDLDHLPDTAAKRSAQAARRDALQHLADQQHTTPLDLQAAGVQPTPAQLRKARPHYLLGTDLLGRSLLIRCLTGGGISLCIGISAALLSVILGTLYGATAAYAGGRIDSLMMRTVDILYGLPYILLVVLLAVAVDARLESIQTSRAASAPARQAAYIDHALSALDPADRANPTLLDRLKQDARARYPGELSPSSIQAIQLITLLVAIGGVSWLTMARVIRGQVLSLKSQPFIEAARAIGASPTRIFLRHLLPNLLGPITVYATLTVPQAILQESFLSFLGIGIKPPLPSWGNLAADGLTELNPYKSNWWLLAFPCLLLATTLLSLNVLGESLRNSLDPRRARR